MLPTHERLRADDAAVAEACLRLRDDATVLIIDWYGDSLGAATRLPIADAWPATSAATRG